MRCGPKPPEEPEGDGKQAQPTIARVAIASATACAGPYLDAMVFHKAASTPVFLKRLPNRDFNRRVIAILPIEPERLGRKQRWLCHEARH
jgi:hypothetical protein